MNVNFIEDGSFNTKAFGAHITEQRAAYLSLEARLNEILSNNFSSNAALSPEVLITDFVNDDDVLCKTMAIGLGCIDMDLSLSFPIDTPNFSNQKILDVFQELIEGLKVLAKHEEKELIVNRLN